MKTRLRLKGTRKFKIPSLHEWMLKEMEREDRTYLLRKLCGFAVFGLSWFLVKLFVSIWYWHPFLDIPIHLGMGIAIMACLAVWKGWLGITEKKEDEQNEQ